MHSLRVWGGKCGSAQYLYSSWSQTSAFFMGKWNVTSLNGKKQELDWEAVENHLDIVGVSSTKCRGSDTVELNEGWKRFYSGVDVTVSAQVGIGTFVSFAWPTVSLIGSHSKEGFASLSLGYKSGHCAFCRCTHQMLKHITSLS